MSFTRVNIEGLRNINPIKIIPSPRFNIVYGQNGSGKTSILEALFILSRAKSFRSSRSVEIINNKLDRLTLFANFLDTSIGVEKSNQCGTKININGEKGKTASQLCSLVPIQLINYHSFSFLEGGSAARRQFLDWGVFHVEPAFFSLWNRYMGFLKQRNAQLKHKNRPLIPWDKNLALLGEEMDFYRRKSIIEFIELWNTIKKDLAIHNVDLAYKRGWDSSMTLIQSLESCTHKDLSIGYTSVGPHKADIIVTVNGRSAEKVLSRGQQKLLIFTLKLAQSLYVREKINKNPVLLMDDVDAELDCINTATVLNLMNMANSQVWLTSIDPFKLNLDQYGDVSLFHVKHGVVTDKSKCNNI